MNTDDLKNLVNSEGWKLLIKRLDEEEEKLLRQLVQNPDPRIAGKIEGVRFVKTEIDYLSKKPKEDKLFNR